MRRSPTKYEGGTRFLDVIDFIRVVKLTGCDMAHIIAVLEEVQKE